MNAAPHRVRRLRLRLSAATPAEAFERRAPLRDAVLEVVLPSLEAAFDELAPGDEVLHIERLELHARVRSLDELSRVLPELVRRELVARVRGEGPGAPEPVARTSPAQARAAALARYLTSGALPWHADAASLEPARLGALDADALLPLAAPALAELPPFQRASACFRLLQVLPDERWGGAASELLRATRAPAAFEPAVAALRALSEMRLVARHTRLRFGAALLASAVARSLRPSSADVIAFLVATGSASEAAARAELGGLPGEVERALHRLGVVLAGESDVATPPELVATPAPERAIGVGRGALATVPAALAPNAPDAPSARDRSVATSDASAPRNPSLAGAPAVPVAGHPSATAPLDGHAAERAVRATMPEAPALRAEAGPRLPNEGTVPRAFGATPASAVSFGRAAPYAGLILLHPFLSRFFVHTGVKREAERALEAPLLPRAAALLHACVSVASEPFEPELAFIKVLLGLELDATLLVGAGLVSDTDRGEVDALLRAAIDHWTALRKTSPDGLRTTFLQRAGLVREDERGYRLQVDPSSFDVLLAQVPWGIGIVKLPWARKVIYTEWVSP